MADKRWKRVEREKCRALGGERSGPTGRDTPDCGSSVHVGLEVKSYKKFVFLAKDWEQAVANAAKVGKPPVLVVRETGHRGRDVVQMRSYDVGRLEGLAGVYDSHTALSHHLIGPDVVRRLPWSDFVRLYRAAFNIDQGEQEQLGN